MNMKALMILGSLVGFLVGTGFGLASSSPWPSAFWRACVAALAAGFLTRWWGRVWLSGLRDSLEKRHSQNSNPEAKAASKV